jgi:hypothetical protein
MIALLLTAVLAAQGPGALQPGTGIVTGTLKTEDGRPAAGVRVGAVDIEDTSASSLLSVTETDSAGRYRLTNVPSGRYYIVAGRLADLHYYPRGADRSTAGEIQVEAARIRADVNFTVPGGSQRAPQVLKGPLFPKNAPETVAYEKLAAEPNLVRMVQLLAQFERDFPRSSRLPEAYVKVSRLFAGQRQMDRALQYAEKAANLAKNLKAQVAPNSDPRWMRWVASMESSVQGNLAWVKQMDAWQSKALFSAVAPVRK